MTKNNLGDSRTWSFRIYLAKGREKNLRIYIERINQNILKYLAKNFSEYVYLGSFIRKISQVKNSNYYFINDSINALALDN